MHGIDHTTQDIDFAFSRGKEDLENLVRALAPFSPRPVDFPSDLPFVWDAQLLRSSSVLTLDSSEGRLDLLAEPPGVGTFEELYRKSIIMEVAGVPIRTASIDDLIAMKAAVDRPKDRINLMQLRALKQVLQEQINAE